MRAVVQRCTRGSVTVGGEVVGALREQGGLVVLLGVVCVHVVMMLGQVQPHPSGHQGTRHQQDRRHRLTQPGYGERCAEERRYREVRSRACSAEVPQCHDE